MTCEAERSTIEMHLNDFPFEQMRRGEKTVEIRLCDEKRSKIHKGDIILFYRMDGEECIRSRVKALHHAQTFAEFFEMPDMLAMAGFADMSPVDAVDCMHQYYTEEQELQYGILGIELCELKKDQEQ